MDQWEDLDKPPGYPASQLLRVSYAAPATLAEAYLDFFAGR
jgi:hypothetical protein